MLLDTVSYDSWPSATWQKIIREKLASYAAMSASEFTALLTKQLQMVVANEANMQGERLEAFLSPHRTALGRASFFEHQVRHYDSKYTSELTQHAAPERDQPPRQDRLGPGGPVAADLLCRAARSRHPGG